MLNIYFGDMDRVIYNTEIYFKNDYDPEWLNDSVVKEMVLDVDNSVVLSSEAIDSPVMGGHSSDEFAGRGEDTNFDPKGTREGIQRFQLRG